MGPLPDSVPAIGRLIVDARGNIWASESVPDESDRIAWNIVDPSGAYLSRVLTPKGFNVFEIGTDYVLGVTDEDDLQTVQVYRLLPSSP